MEGIETVSRDLGIADDDVSADFARRLEEGKRQEV